MAAWKSLPDSETFGSSRAPLPADSSGTGRPPRQAAPAPRCQHGPADGLRGCHPPHGEAALGKLGAHWERSRLAPWRARRQRCAAAAPRRGGHGGEAAPAPSPGASKPLSSGAAARGVPADVTEPRGKPPVPPCEQSPLPPLPVPQPGREPKPGLAFPAPLSALLLAGVAARACGPGPANAPRTQPGGARPSRPRVRTEEFAGASCPSQGYLLPGRAPPSHLLPLPKRACPLPPGPHPGPHIHLGSASRVSSSTARLILNP